MWWITAYLVQVCISLCICIREVGRPQRALTWALLNLLFPGLALIAYLILAQPLPARRKVRTHGESDHSPDTDTANEQLPPGLPASFAAAVRQLAADSPKPARVKLLQDGVDTFDILAEMIMSAQHTIDIEYYIFRDDHVGQRIIRHLCRAAERGVRVRFLRDALGSHQLSKKALQELTAAGVSCRVFAPVRLSKLNLVNHRDHCKIVVIDGQEALVGGINVGDEYTGKTAKYGPWRDTDLWLQGEAARQIQGIFETNYAAAEQDGKAKVAARTRPTGRIVQQRAMAITEASAELAPGSATTGDDVWPALVQTVESGPDNPVQRIRQAFFLAVTMAQTSICLTTPYFAPDADLSMALRAAASRAVRVRMLVPWKADHALIAWASWTYYQPLLESGVEIFLYDAGVLHAKTLVLDGEVSMVGAANCDLRSFRQNYELVSVVYDKHTAAELAAQFERDLESSRQLTMEMLQARSFFDHVREQSARLLAPML